MGKGVQWPEEVPGRTQSLEEPGIVSSISGNSPGWEAGGRAQGDRGMEVEGCVRK